jgi:squalene synthase HpnC
LPVRNATRAVPAPSGENFPVALRLLPRDVRGHLLALYAYARYVDDLGDEPIAGPSGERRIAALDEFEAGLRGVYAGRPAEHPVLAAIAPTIAECKVPMDPLVRLVEANRTDQIVSRYATFEQLVEYCHLSADPVGEVVLHIFGQATPGRIAQSDRVCTALQIVEHLQDIREDYGRDRVYLPKDDIDRFGVAVSELAEPTASTALRRLVAYEAGRATEWLGTGSALIGDLSGWARVAVAGYVGGGRAALRALARAGYDPMPGPPKASQASVAVQVLRAVLGGGLLGGGR